MTAGQGRQRGVSVGQYDPTMTFMAHYSVAGSDPANAAAAVAAWIALGLSILGLLVSIVLRHLDGPRARVGLRPVLRDVARGRTLTFGRGTWPVPVSEVEQFIRGSDQEVMIELAEIVIENVGRHPMTVFDVGFSWRGPRPRWWKPNEKRSSVPLPIPVSSPKDYSVGDRLRLEPASISVFLVDYWGVVLASRPNERGFLDLRAEVSVAGRRRPRRSSHRLRWRIPDSAQRGLARTTKISLQSVVARTLSLKVLHDQDLPHLNVAQVAAHIGKRIGGSWPAGFDEQAELIESVLRERKTMYAAAFTDESWRLSLLVLDLIDDIEARKDDIDWGASHPGATVTANADRPAALAPAAPPELRHPRRASRAAGPPLVSTGDENA